MTRYLLIPVVLLALLAPTARADEASAAFKLGERFFRDSLYNLAVEQYRKFLSVSHSPEQDPEVHFKIALCEYRQGNVREASIGFDEYTRMFPGDDHIMDAYYLAGKAYLTLKEYKEASDRFGLVWSRFAGSARAQSALFEAAGAARMAGNPERAIELYDVYFRRFPKDSRSREVSLALAALYTDARNYEAAEDALAKGADQWGGDKAYARRMHYYRARMAWKMQRTDDAADAFSSMMQSANVAFPEQEQALRDYLAFLQTTGSHAPALKVYPSLEELLRARGERMAPSMIVHWAESARRAKAYKQADKLYRKVLDAHPDSIDVLRARYHLAECRIGLGDFAGAIETLQNLALDDSLEEYGAKAIRKIGDLYHRKKLFVPAIAAYRRYLDLPTARNADAILYRIGVIFQDDFSQYGSAAREYEELLKRYPTSSFALRSILRLAQCLEELGDHQAALRNYRYLTESSSGTEVGDNARERIGYLETYRVKDVEGAAQALAELMSDQRRDSLPQHEYLRRMAVVYQRYLKDYDRAIQSLEDVLALQPPVSDSIAAAATYTMATSYEKLARKAEVEGSPKTAAYARDKALSLYGTVTEKYAGSRWDDDAAFRTMMVSTPGIAEYERFIEQFPESRHLPEVLHSIGAHYEKAAGGKREEDLHKAIAAYSRVAGLQSRNGYAPEALLGVGRCFLELGLLDSTEQAVSDLFSRYDAVQWRPEGLYLRGVVERRRGNNTKAIETFRELLYEHPFSAFAGQGRYELAEAQLATGNVFEALSNFRVVSQTGTDETNRLQVQLGIGTCLARMGKHEEAQALLNELLEQELPADLEGRVAYVLASIAEARGDVYKALDLYKKVLGTESFASRTDVYGHVAKLYFDNRVYNEAGDAYRKAYDQAATAQDSVRFLRGGITALIMDGKAKAADKLIAQYKEQYPSDVAGLADIVYHEGLRLIHVKEYEKAEKRFGYILNKYDGGELTDDAAYQLALAVFYAGDKERAGRLFVNFVTKYPQSEYVPYAQFKQGMLLHEQEQYGRAAEMFATVAGSENADPKTRFRAMHNAAIDYQKELAWVDAARMYGRMLEEFPEDLPASVTHLKIGFCLMQGSRFEQAIGHFTKANVDPADEDKPEILYWLGMAYAKTGEYQKSLTNLLKVPYLYSGAGKWGITAELEAARIYERRGEYERAKSLYRKVVRSDGENGQFGRAASKRLRLLSNLVLESQ